jgi:heptosyltransferase III
MRRILIFQIGSLGDTVIAMPCYREIMRRHPGDERYILTNLVTGGKMVQAEMLLAPCGLVDGVLKSPFPLKSSKEILALRRRIRELRFDVLYYLGPEKRTTSLLRQYFFFRACGIKTIHGIPWTRDKRLTRPLEGGGRWESEASRMLRAIDARQNPGPPNRSDRSLDLSSKERSQARKLLSEVPALDAFIAVSVGGKLPIKDWGDTNWRNALASLSAAHPGLGAVFVGSQDERARNDALASAWEGPTLNACGRLAPRETAALIECAALYLGHDTGTLHLAAAVGTRIVGIYSARDVPGKWFSDNEGDRFFYNKPACFNCGLINPEDCSNQVVCMTGHKVEAVVAAATELLAQTLKPIPALSSIRSLQSV